MSTCFIHLVALHPPDLQDPPGPAHQRELGPLEEDGAAVWPRVALHVDAGRVRLGQEAAGVTHGAEGPLQEVEVVHLLQADDVGVLGQELLQDPPPS